MSENSRTTGTHQTGVNPRTKVARSHAPASIETQERTNVRAVNDEERSGSGNMFRRLDRG